MFFEIWKKRKILFSNTDLDQHSTATPDRHCASFGSNTFSAWGYVEFTGFPSPSRREVTLTSGPITQGSHASLKVLEFFLLNSRPWKYLKTGQVLESLNFIPEILESTWIQQFKLRDISNFIKPHLYMTGMHVLYLLRNLPGILPDTRFANNCHVLFLSTKTVP